MTGYAQGGQVGPIRPVFAAAVIGTMRRARYVEAKDHRARLIRYGEYVKTSQSTRARLLQIVSRTITSPDPDDELAALTCHCGRIACRHHQEEP